MRWMLILVVMIVLGIAASSIVGCGSSDTPSQVVEKYYKYTQENDCQKVADLVRQNGPSYDRYFNDCQKYAGKLASYSIKKESIEENGAFAHVEVEVAIKEDGVEKTNFPSLTLFKSGNDWKLTKTES